jgi:hypothetical protein
VRVNGDTIFQSQYHGIGGLDSIGKTPEHFYYLYYPQRKNPATAFDNLIFIMEEAVAGTTVDAPLEGIVYTDTDTDTDTNTY